MATEIYRPYDLDTDVSGTGTSWPHTIAKSSIDVWIDNNIPVGATIDSITFACEAQKSRTFTFGGNVTVKVGNNTIINNVNINSTGYSNLINNDIKNCFGERYINDNIVFSFSCNQSCTFYLRNVVITFNYTIPTYKITTVASPSEGGTVSGGGTYNSGDSATLTATSYTGWYIADWLKNGVSMGFENVGTFHIDVVADVTYTAIFKKRTYTITWRNYDDSIIKTETVEYGTVPTYSGSTPTKPSDDYYNYGFVGWLPDDDEAIYNDKVFTAQFAQTDRYYTVRWLNASIEEGVEGEELEKDEVLFKTKPDYDEVISGIPEHPKQNTDTGFNYTFIGWSATVTDPPRLDTDLEEVKGDITYTAIYNITPKLYDVTVILFDSQFTTQYEYGSKIKIEAPKFVEFHQFVQWTDGSTENSRTDVEVTGEATYQAIYERIPVPIRINLEQVTGVYIVPDTDNPKTGDIVYVIDGTIPIVESENNAISGWNFIVSNTIPNNGYTLEKLYISNISNTRIY